MQQRRHLPVGVGAPGPILAGQQGRQIRRRLDVVEDSVGEDPDPVPGGDLKAMTVIRVMALSTGSGSAEYISTPWHSTAGKGETGPRSA